MSLSNAPLTTTIRVTDLERAKSFYKNKLGLNESSHMTDEYGALYEAGGGTKLYVYQGPPSKAEHTLASFRVSDVLAKVNELKSKGVQFESYDMDPIKTDENNIAHMGKMDIAWFKDPDGNILAIGNE